MSQSHYQTLDPPYAGMPNALSESKASNRKAKWLVIGSVIAVLVLAGIGTAVGVIVSRNNSKSSASSSSTGKANGGSSGSGGTVISGDPSVFDLDPNLHKSFYGIAYTPEDALIELGCGNTLEGTIADIQLISQLTNRIRLYGADCNQTAQVLEAIELTQVDLSVFLGIYTMPQDPEAFTRQLATIRQAIEDYGVDHIEGITVGNEFMLNYVTEIGSTDANTAEADVGAQILVDDIDATRAMLAELNLPKTILVGNSDAGSYFSNLVMENIDYGLSNVHAWFANTTEEEAAPWVFNFFEETNVAPAALLPNNPQMYIAETGWPTTATDPGSITNGPGTASEEGLQIFLDTFVCEANANGVRYFFFEMFDERWKEEKYGGVEGAWGLFTREGGRALKNIQIPTCLI